MDHKKNCLCPRKQNEGMRSFVCRTLLFYAYLREKRHYALFDFSDSSQTPFATGSVDHVLSFFPRRCLFVCLLIMLSCRCCFDARSPLSMHTSFAPGEKIGTSTVSVFFFFGLRLLDRDPLLTLANEKIRNAITNDFTTFLILGFHTEVLLLCQAEKKHIHACFYLIYMWAVCPTLLVFVFVCVLDIILNHSSLLYVVLLLPL